jgi:hypothetical protein
MTQLTSVTFEEELKDAAKELDLIVKVVERYVEQYTEDWEVLHVEEEFLYILPNNEVVTFTPDLVVRDKNGAVWIIDHKTTSRGVEGGIPFGDMQSLLYYAGVRELYPECAGFIFNRLRKKIPTKPRLTKTGKTRVADLERIDTTYEVLRDFLQDKAPGLLSDPAHQRRLAKLRDQGDRFFWTEQVYVNDATVEAVVADVAHLANEIVGPGMPGKYHYPRHLLESNGYKDCRKCPYQRLCHAELVGWDTETILEEDYKPRGPKNEYESV